MKVWLPSCLNRQGEIDRLARSLNMNSERLGGLQVKCEHWPDVPAGVLEISWDEESPVELYKKESQEDVEKARQDTIHFVETRIAKLGLCPYTKSMKRAAIGLEALGVQEGPVVIRHAGELESSERATPAAVMGALFWRGITELLERPETEVATLLLVCPQCYDEDFEAY